MQHLTEENHSITYPSENLPIKKRLDNSWMTISMVQNFWCYWSLKRVYFQSYKLQLIQLHYWEKVYQDQHVNGAGSNLIAYILIQLSFFWNLSKKALFKNGQSYLDICKLSNAFDFTTYVVRHFIRNGVHCQVSVVSCGGRKRASFSW